MNALMSDIRESTFSYFDTKGHIKDQIKTAESFQNCFILGLLVNIKDCYTITSNRESGCGRYDICMCPKQRSDHGIVIEFKAIAPTQE